jgi:hypothetical protein
MFQLHVFVFDNLRLICLVIDVALEKLLLLLNCHLSGVMLPHFLVLDILYSLLHARDILVDHFQLQSDLPVDFFFLFKT